jgi:rubrerythrin
VGKEEVSMTLSTFGAIMEFAIAMTGQTKSIYETLIERVEGQDLKETLRSLAMDEARIGSLMEKTRREHVVEMILEPVSEFYKDDYQVDLNEFANLAPLSVALRLEERGLRFFQVASEKLQIPEVTRILKKTARKKEENLRFLKSLGGSRD